MNSSFKNIVFSDVDGTLVHYPTTLPSEDEKNLIFLPPSKTGTRGILSTRTMELCQQLRHGPQSTSAAAADGSINSLEQRQQNGGVPLILISGMRTTTLFQRLPYLPRADAYVSESGGRIFYPRTLSSQLEDGKVPDLIINPIASANTESAQFTLVEDMEWRRQISNVKAAGPDGFQDSQHQMSIEQRAGKLWEYATHLTKQGYVLDTSGYSTAFRVNRMMQSEHLLDNFDEFIERCLKRHDLPEELGCSTNLGCVDIYPIMSGKKKCCEYLVQKFLGSDQDAASLLSTRAFCMCDDDNDIEMALACKTAFLPSITSESIRQRVNDRQVVDGVEKYGQLLVTEDVDVGVVETGATERALEMILAELK